MSMERKTLSGDVQQGGRLMLKATLRSAVLLALVAFGMAMTSVPSFAEVQNVKVGGDVTIRAFHCENLDLQQEDRTSSGSTTPTLDDEDDFIMQTTGINIGADLTENVAANIRLVNERDWDQSVLESTNGGGNVNLSQAYITLKELFYAPLTLRMGTQPIVWGRGFVLGSGLFPSVNGMGGDRNGSITANEFTDLTAFDAIRATLDLAGVAGMPLTFDAVYIKFDENTAGIPDDVNLVGFNLGTQVDGMNSEFEAYYLNKRDKNTELALNGTAATFSGDRNEDDGSVSTLGIRGSAKPAEGTQVWAELAYQFGKRNIDAADPLPSGDSQQAWAVNLAADYTFGDVATSPKLGLEWRFYSGKDVDGAVNGWAPMAPGYFTTALREFQTGQGVLGFYANDDACSAAGASAATTPCTASGSNQNELAIFGSLTPIEDLTVAPRLSWFILDVGARSRGADGVISKRESYAGMEWDTVVNYNYTDDVQMGFIYALFNPGSAYTNPFNSTAQELITSVSGKF